MNERRPPLIWERPLFPLAALAGLQAGVDSVSVLNR